MIEAGARAPLRGLFLDLDGTLADSLTMLRSAYHAFLGSFGRRGSEAEFQSLNGPPLRRIVELLQQAHGLSGAPDVLLDFYLARLHEAHDQIRPSAGAKDVLAFARRQGWFAMVVTSSPHAETVAWLQRTGLDTYINGVVGGDDVACGKPDPEPYRLALARASCSAELSLAIEDSAQGAVSACAAGLPTWFLGSAAPVGVAALPQFQGCLQRFVDLLEVLKQRQSCRR